MRFWLAVALLLVLLAGTVVYARLPGNRDSGFFATDPPTPYFHYTPTGTSRGRILVLHGLDASKNVMNLLSYALANAGFEVFAIDLAGHGDSPASFNAVTARDIVAQVLDKVGPGTAVLGHSFGSTLLLDIADDRHVTSMVLFSPAPAPLTRILADRILVLEGQFDPAPIRRFVPQIEDAATGTFELRELAWTGHSTGLFQPRVIEGVVQWLGGRPGQGHTAARLWLLGLMMASATGAGIVFLGMARPAAPTDSWPNWPNPVHLSILAYGLAGLVAVVVVTFVNVAGWTRLFVMDYLIGFLFLTGLLLLPWCRLILRVSLRNLLIALVAATFIIVMVNWIASEVAHVTVSGQRWWRFPAVTSLSLPLFLADEGFIRPLRSRWVAAWTAATTRLVVLAIAVSGALILDRQAGFLLLLAHLIFLFLMGLWLCGELIRQRTDAFSTALFTALVQAWMFSALFVTT